jgi:hypothetical protein
MKVGLLQKWLSLFILGLMPSLNGSVEEIVIKWNAFTCDNVCVPGIEMNLNSIKRIDNLKINARSGVAVMTWDPNYPFIYEPFRLAMSAAGVRINDIRLTVKGRITSDSENFYLISNGDLAKFWLIGPIKVQEDRYIPKNIASHAFDAETKMRLYDAQDNGLDVTVTGPLYLPTQYPRTLVAGQIKIDTKHKKMNPAYMRD